MLPALSSRSRWGTSADFHSVVRAVVTLGGGTNRETGEIIPRRPVVQVGPHHVVGGSPSVDGGGLLTSALPRYRHGRGQDGRHRRRPGKCRRPAPERRRSGSMKRDDFVEAMQGEALRLISSSA